MTGSSANGQSTVELAVVLPVVLILVLVVVQVGLVARDQVAVHHTINQVARRSSLGPAHRPDPVSAAQASPLRADRVGLTFEGGEASGELLTVTLSYRSPTEVPVVGALVDDIDLSATAVVRTE
jgi:Flp pilus assembly protein TadG